MMENIFKSKKFLIVSSIILIGASLTYSTYAWFAVIRANKGNIDNVTVEDNAIGLIAIKSFIGNYDNYGTTEASYSGYEIQFLGDNYSYESSFLEYNEDNLNMEGLTPNVRYTFAIEVENYSSSERSVNLYLDEFISNYSASCLDVDTQKGIQLASAIDIFGFGVKKSQYTDEMLNNFLLGYNYLDKSKIEEDRFNFRYYDEEKQYYDYSYIEDEPDTGKYSNQDILICGETANSQNTTEVDGNIVLLFLTFSFSNENDCEYTYQSYSNNKYVYKYGPSELGEHNAYASLDFNINNLQLKSI